MISSNTSLARGRLPEVVLTLRGSGLLCEEDFFICCSPKDLTLRATVAEVLLTSTNNQLPAQQRSPTEGKIYNLTG